MIYQTHRYIRSTFIEIIAFHLWYSLTDNTCALLALNLHGPTKNAYRFFFNSFIVFLCIGMGHQAQIKTNGARRQ